MRLLFNFLLLVATLGFTSCSLIGPKSVSGEVAVAHTTLAIVPPLVSLERRKNDTQTKIWAAEDAQTYALQEELYRWVLNRKKKGRFVGVDIMRMDVVNEKLSRYGFTLDSRKLTPGEMAEVLGVDLVIFAHFETTRPAGKTVAAALVALTNTYVDSYNTTVQLEYIDAAGGSLWGYNWSESGSFTSSEELIKNLMRRASRQMPYVAR